MKTCLVIEDNAIIRDIIVQILKDLQVEAVEAENATDGVAYCEKAKPDVVLLDWDLPAMGALDFLRGIGSFTEDRRPTIVLCATENDPQQFTLAQAAGAQYHLLKPFDKPIIAEKLIEIGIIESPLHVTNVQEKRPQSR